MKKKIIPIQLIYLESVKEMYHSLLHTFYYKNIVLDMYFIHWYVLLCSYIINKLYSPYHCL